MLVCIKCAQTLPEEKFPFKNKQAGTHHHICKMCKSAYNKQHYENNKELYLGPHLKWNRLWSKYRLRQNDWWDMLHSQGNVCAVCKDRPPVEVDHDHTCCDSKSSCGKCVRGIVCKRCNLVLRYYDDEVFSSKIMQYRNR